MIIPADIISSRCTSRGGTIFAGGADAEQSKIANTPRRNSETNSFENRGAKFGSRINLSEKDSVEAVSSKWRLIGQFETFSHDKQHTFLRCGLDSQWPLSGVLWNLRAKFGHNLFSRVERNVKQKYFFLISSFNYNLYQYIQEIL
jgi:hypothetical protein